MKTSNNLNHGKLFVSLILIQFRTTLLWLAVFSA